MEIKKIYKINKISFAAGEQEKREPRLTEKRN